MSYMDYIRLLFSACLPGRIAVIDMEIVIMYIKNKQQANRGGSMRATISTEAISLLHCTFIPQCHPPSKWPCFTEHSSYSSFVKDYILERLQGVKDYLISFCPSKETQVLSDQAIVYTLFPGSGILRKFA